MSDVDTKIWHGFVLLMVGSICYSNNTGELIVGSKNCWYGVLHWTFLKTMTQLWYGNAWKIWKSNAMNTCFMELLPHCLTGILLISNLSSLDELFLFPKCSYRCCCWEMAEIDHLESVPRGKRWWFQIYSLASTNKSLWKRKKYLQRTKHRRNLISFSPAPQRHETW